MRRRGEDSIPGPDALVIGYDDEEIARHLTPPLTTLVLPHRDWGAWPLKGAVAGANQRRPHPPDQA